MNEVEWFSEVGRWGTRRRGTTGDLEPMNEQKSEIGAIEDEKCRAILEEVEPGDRVTLWTEFWNIRDGRVVECDCRDHICVEGGLGQDRFALKPSDLTLRENPEVSSGPKIDRIIKWPSGS